MADDKTKVIFEIDVDMKKASLDKMEKSVQSYFKRIVGDESFYKLNKMFVRSANDLNNYSAQIKNLDKELSNFGKTVDSNLLQTFEKIRKSGARGFKEFQDTAILSRTAENLKERISVLNQLQSGIKGKSRNKALWRLDELVSEEMELPTPKYKKNKSVINDALGKDFSYIEGTTRIDELVSRIGGSVGLLEDQIKKNVKTVRNISEKYTTLETVLTEQISEGKQSVKLSKKSQDDLKKRILAEQARLVKEEEAKKDELKNKVLEEKKRLEQQEKERQKEIASAIKDRQNREREAEKFRKDEERRKKDYEKKYIAPEQKRVKEQKEVAVIISSVQNKEKLLSLMREQKNAEKSIEETLAFQEKIQKEISQVEEKRLNLKRKIELSENESKETIDKLNKEYGETVKLENNLNKLRKSSETSLIRQNKELSEQQKKSAGIISKFKDAIKNAFTLDKLFNRMAFVLTAKISYEAFDFINRSLREGFQNAVLLESQLKRIYSISRDQNQKVLKDAVISATKLGFSPQDVAESAYQTVSAQFSTSETAKLLEVSSKMAVAGFTTQKEAIDALTTVLNAYKLDVADASRVSDIFFKTIELGKAELIEISPVIGKISATASLLGISFEEVSAGIATMTLNGIKTNVAVTSLNQLLMNITAPTKEAKDIFDKYNISLDVAQIRTKGLAGVVKDLNALTDEEIATIASSNRGFRALATAINSSAEWQNNYNKIVDSSGSTQSAFNDQMETTEMRLKRLKGEFIGIGVTLGNFISVLTPVLDVTIIPLIKGLNNVTVSLFAITGGVYALTKAIKYLSMAGSFNLWMAGLTAVVAGLAIYYGKTLKAKEDLDRFVKESTQREIDASQKIISSKKEELNLLKTAKFLQEKELSGSKLSRNEKDLLISSQQSLNEKYKIGAKNLSDYNKAISDNIAEQEKQFNIQKQIKLNEKKSEYFSSVKGLSNVVFASSTVTSTGGYSEFSKEINELRKKTETLQSGLNAGVFSDATKLSKIEGIFNVYNSIIDSLEKSKTKENFAEVDKKINNFKTSYKNTINSLINIRDYTKISVEKLSKSGEEIKAGGIENGTTSKDIFEPRFNDSKWKSAKETYHQGKLTLEELKTAKNAYDLAVKNFYIKEPDRATALSDSAMSDMISLVERRTNAKIRLAEKTLEASKSEEEYNSNLFELKNAYLSQISQLSEIKVSDDKLDDLTDAFEARFGKETIEAKFTKKIIQKKLDQQLFKEELDYTKKEDKELYDILESANYQTIIELESWMAQNAEQLSLYTALETELKRLIDQRKKALVLYDEAVSSRMQGGVGTGFLGAMGFQKSESSIRIEAVKDSELPQVEKDKIIAEETSKMQIAGGERIYAETENLLNATKALYDNYLNARLEQIEAEKNAKLEALDTQAKTEYRSTLWLESEKDKIEKKAEKERKKLNKERKASMIGEAIAGQALGITKIWANKGYTPVVASILTALMLAVTGTQIATIQKQKFAKGGIVKGKRHSQGGVPIEAEGNEMIFSRRATMGNESLLMNLNSALEGKKISGLTAGNISQKVINNSSSNTIISLEKQFEGLQKSIENIQMNVVLQGEFLSDIKLSKKVENGNRKRSVL